MGFESKETLVPDINSSFTGLRPRFVLDGASNVEVQNEVSWDASKKLLRSISNTCACAYCRLSCVMKIDLGYECASSLRILKYSAAELQGRRFHFLLLA